MLFPPRGINKNDPHEKEKYNSSIFKINGYKDYENLWYEQRF